MTTVMVLVFARENKMKYTKQDEKTVLIIMLIISILVIFGVEILIAYYPNISNVMRLCAGIFFGKWVNDLVKYLQGKTIFRE